MLQLCDLIGSSEFQLAYPYIYICNLMYENDKKVRFFKKYYKFLSKWVENVCYRFLFNCKSRSAAIESIR